MPTELRTDFGGAAGIETTRGGNRDRDHFDLDRRCLDPVRSPLKSPDPVCALDLGLGHSSGLVRQQLREGERS